MKKGLITLIITTLTINVFGQIGDGSENSPLCWKLQQDITIGPGLVYIGDPNIANYLKTNGYTLTIAPGTTLLISDDGVLEAGGTGNIQAIGSQGSPILFKSRNSNGNWRHLNFTSCTIRSEFDYCSFEGGNAGIDPASGIGGAISIEVSPVLIENCTFLGNSAYEGGALFIRNSSGVIVNNSVFRNNSSFEGGAIALINSAADFTGCVFDGNAVTEIDNPLEPKGRGGAIYIEGNQSHLFSRCKIYSNTTDGRTGGIHFATDAAGRIENCLIYGNTSSVGGGISMGTSITNPGTLVTVVNCLVAENEPSDVTFRTSEGFIVQNSVIWGSDRSVWYISHGGGDPLASNLVNCAVQGALDQNDVQMNIESSFTNSFHLDALNDAVGGPNFIDPVNHDYRIRLFSPCRDRGIASVTYPAPETDILGNSRVDETDIGAYEVMYNLWTGASNDEVWGTPGNWSLNEVPASGITNVIIPAGAINYPTSLTSQDFEVGQYNDLLLEPGAQVTLSNLTINGQVLLQSTGVTDNSSLIITGTTSGSGTMTYLRTIPDDGDTQLWHYLASPVVPTGISVNDNPEYFYPYDEVLGTWGAGTLNLERGLGYAIIGGGSAVFRGHPGSPEMSIPATSPYSDSQDVDEPYDNRVFVSIEDVDNHSGDVTRSNYNYGGGGFNLLGNPYTSALRVTDLDGSGENDFLTYNSAAFDLNYKAVYLYNGNSYSYIGSPAGGWEENDPESNMGTQIQVGQAFFVLAMNDYSTFSFKPEMQVHNPGVALLKSAEADERWPGVRLKATDGKHESSTLIIFNDNMTMGLDPGFDVGIMSAGTDIETYTTLAGTDNEVNFARQALPLEDTSDLIVPIGLDLQNGGTITFSADVVPVKLQKFLFEDRITGDFTDLSKETYSIALPGKSYGTGRFFLHCTSQNRRSLKPDGAYPEMADVRIWTSGREVIIKGSVGQQALCEVYNPGGQQVITTRLTNGELNIIDMASFISGAYIVRVIDGESLYTKKIVLF